MTNSLQRREEFIAFSKCVTKATEEVGRKIPQKAAVKKQEPKRVVESILFSANEPVSLRKIALFLQKSEREVEEIIETLNQEYEKDGHAFRIHKVVSGYQLYTLSEYSELLENFFQKRKAKLSKAAREVLAIIAFNQPITKPEIEKIRGVDSTSTIHYLLEKRLIRIEGRAKRLGAPFLYRTTKEFLKYFGLFRLEDLPQKEELESFFQSVEERKEE